MVTTTSMTAESPSSRIDQSETNSPTWMKGARVRVKGCSPPQVHWAKTTQDRTADRTRRPVVTAWDARAPSRDPNRPASRAPTRGPKTMIGRRACALISETQPFITEASSTAMSPRFRKKVTRIARPTAASAAATVRMNMA